MKRIDELKRDQEKNERSIRFYQYLIEEAKQNGDDTEGLEDTLNNHRRYFAMTAEMILHLEAEMDAGVNRPQSMPRTADERKDFYERYNRKNWKQ